MITACFNFIKDKIVAFLPKVNPVKAKELLAKSSIDIQNKMIHKMNLQRHASCGITFLLNKKGKEYKIIPVGYLWIGNIPAELNMKMLQEKVVEQLILVRYDATFVKFTISGHKTILECTLV